MGVGGGGGGEKEQGALYKNVGKELPKYAA